MVLISSWLNKLHKILLYRTSVLKNATIQLPSSKSESNRALIINALCSHKSTLKNLSKARDTQILQDLLLSQGEVLDVMDAGTTLRFLTAYLAVQGQPKILTGTPRMCDRPIQILVDALRQLGAKIEYLQKEGYPPIKILGKFDQSAREIEIPGNVSSQYISALLMIAPSLPQGLILHLQGKIASKPYIKMTLSIMGQFGVEHHWVDSKITIKPQTYQPAEYEIEADWSGASYWFSLVALAQKGELNLPGLRQNSLQGDSQIINIMNHLGVHTQFHSNGIFISKKPGVDRFSYNFLDYPDLAQTVIVCCAAKGIRGVFTGLHSLRIKETDRIGALQTELVKFGATLEEKQNGEWMLVPGKNISQPLTFSTYDDHRMAMSLAPLATQEDLFIENPQVVVKSFPDFWEELNKAGVRTKLRSGDK